MSERFRFERRTINVAGYHTRLHEAGEGASPPTVIVASMLVLARSYRPLLKALSRTRRTIVLELPGSGRASPLSRPWSFEDYGAYLADVLAALKLASPTVIGHSNSGVPAMVAATKRPDLFGHLVLVDSVGADMAFSMWRTIGGRAIDAALEPWLTVTGFHHVLFNALVHARNFWNGVRLSAHSDARSTAAAVNVPTLIAWGRRDHTEPMRCAELFQSLIPRAQTYVSPRGSHDWLITHAEEFAAAVDAFTSAAAAAAPPQSTTP